MLKLLYRSAAIWTGLGLAAGLFYREFTKINDVNGWNTQLAVAHTHALALGTTILLILLALAAVFNLGSDKRFVGGVHAWNTGLALTFGTMLVKGCMQVLGNPSADSAAIAGIAGLGHIILTVAFILIFLALRPAVAARVSKDAAAPARDLKDAAVPASH